MGGENLLDIGICPLHCRDLDHTTFETCTITSEQSLLSISVGVSLRCQSATTDSFRVLHSDILFSPNTSEECNKLPIHEPANGITLDDKDKRHGDDTNAKSSAYPIDLTPPDDGQAICTGAFDLF